VDHVAGPGEAIDRRELKVTGLARLDAALAAAFPDLSRARIQRLIEQGHALVNGEVARKSAAVKEGDTVSLSIPAVVHEAVASGLSFPILFEDEVMLAIDKPPGIAVHGAPGDTGPSVAAWFLERYALEAEQFDAERPGIVHRLDKDTSGVLVLAKTPAAQAALGHAFEERTTHKTYLALCDGVPKQPRAVVDAPIARHAADRTHMTIAKRGREARTAYEVLDSARGRSFILANPETGRTHQIRVHLAAIGAPVMFDRMYGKSEGRRQMLHAWRLEIPHPAGRVLRVTAPLPADFAVEVRSLGFEQVALPYLQPVPAEFLEDHP
jgi:23S rRNA pseudouridine1911/1915/1917 synthase